jgi:YD repeat-containing protein
VKRRIDPPNQTPPGPDRITEFDYDPHGNVIAVTDPSGRTTTTSYDELDRPVRIVGPEYTDSSLGLIRPVTV